MSTVRLDRELFPKPDGTAWRRKENLANWLRKRVIDKFPWWSPNLARYWASTLG